MVIPTSASVYSDQLITATELNRQPGRVLDLAWDRPVTVTRNDQYFALLRRDDMAFLIKEATQIKVAFEVINVAYKLRLGEEISADSPYGWLRVFDNEELTELITEVINGYKVALETQIWDSLDAVIHEWNESALAIQSSELDTAFREEHDEVSLTQPTAESIIKQAQV